jgi:hypothetical protein
MNRDYETGTAEDIVFFTGIEVEKTPAFGMKTLFVTGLQDSDTISHFYNEEDCKHIFFGANHSFNPGVDFPKDADAWEAWEDMIMYFLDGGVLCSLDLPLSHAEALLESRMIECENFIPQIRIPLPYIKQYNYNTMLKIDDKDFKATNPGVWCHSLHDLMDRETFTDWSKYGLDKILK